MEQLLSKFINNYQMTSIDETFEKFNIKIKFKSILSFSKEDIEEELKRVNKRDSIRIRLEEGEEYSISKYSSGSYIDEFISDIQDHDYNDDYDYYLTIEIIKTTMNRQLSIYNLDEFINYLDKLSLKGILYEFNRILNEYESILFRVQNNDVCYMGKSISFIKENVNYNEDFLDRKKELEKRVEVCNFLNAHEYKLTPSDFNIQGKGNSKLEHIMKKLECILSIISIGDIVNIINDNEVNIILNGYKRIENTIDYKNFFNDVLEEYIKIYKWTYNDGDIIDKLGIARNLISISIKDNKLTHIENNLMESIISAHNIYLKENVEEYLDAKSKINEFLFDLTQKMSELANSIGKSLYTNLAAAVTFFATIIIMNILSDKKLENIFTKDITILSIVFCLGSIIYMIISTIEVYFEVKRYETQYYRLKYSYDDILEQNDINKIFRDDKYLIEDKQYVLKKSKLYLVAWIIIIIIIFLSSIYLGTFNQDTINNIYYAFKNII